MVIYFTFNVRLAITYCAIPPFKTLQLGINQTNKMKIILAIVGFITILTPHTYGQLEPIDVAEMTIKIGGTKTVEHYYGFAEGDQILFNFEEVKGKPLKVIEIIELPSNSKFMDYKSSLLINKTIK